MKFSKELKAEYQALVNSGVIVPYGLAIASDLSAGDLSVLNALAIGERMTRIDAEYRRLSALDKSKFPTSTEQS